MKLRPANYGVSRIGNHWTNFLALLTVGLKIGDGMLSSKLLKIMGHCGFCILLAVLISACADSSGPTAANLNAAYLESLEVTESQAIELAADPSLEARAVQNLQNYFSSMTPTSVVDKTAAVYAPDAWLYDNIAVVRGLPAIQDYFVKAAGEADSFEVEFLQTIPSGLDYYIRWRMAITSVALADGEPIVSYGVTQFRFDRQGRVLLHRDFWDAGTGLYEYLPVVGGLVQRLRHMLASPTDE